MIVFVCTGNTCRSPIAEGIFRKMLDENKCANVECLSVGVATQKGLPVSTNSVLVCAEIGVDISHLRSLRISDINVDKVELFIAMTDGHAHILESIGISVNKIYTLNEVTDPYGQGIDEYRVCRDKIKKELEILFREKFYR